MAFVPTGESTLFHFVTMKSFSLPACLLVFVIFGHSQPSYVSSVSTVDRLAVIRNSVELTEWHEKSFWTQYNTYLSKTESVSAHLYLSMIELAALTKESDTAEASSRARRMLDLASEQQELISAYYREIGRDHNGVIALQFLQTETQLDLMEGVAVYENTAIRAFRLKPGLAERTGSLQAQYNVLSKALRLTPAEADIFYPIYSRFQAECEEILGTGYSLYELFAGPAADYSPGLAKRIGYDLLTVSKREIELKEKYYDEIRQASGPVVAAQFLAWEDFYSLICKITIWAEAN
jgi:hypothetical protein